MRQWNKNANVNMILSRPTRQWTTLLLSLSKQVFMTPKEAWWGHTTVCKCLNNHHCLWHSIAIQLTYWQFLSQAHFCVLVTTNTESDKAQLSSSSFKGVALYLYAMHITFFTKVCSTFRVKCMYERYWIKNHMKTVQFGKQQLECVALSEWNVCKKVIE